MIKTSFNFWILLLAVLTLAACYDPEKEDPNVVGDAQGPAEMLLMRVPYLWPASKASVRVSDSSAALAEDMPPPYPGTTRSDAMKVRFKKLPPLRSSGAKRCTIETNE